MLSPGSFSGGGLGFGVSFTLHDAFTAVSQRIRYELYGLEQRVTRAADRMNAAFAKMQGGIMMVVAGLGLLTPLGAGVKLAGEFEKSNVAFGTLLGSMEKGKKMLHEIDEMAIESIFTLPEIEKGVQQLLGMSIPAKDVLRDFTALSDIAAALKVDIPRIAVNYGQVKGRGFLDGRELRDFQKMGFDVQRALKDAGIDKDISAGNAAKAKVSWRELQTAIRAATSEGGQFANLNEKIAGTLPGILNNIKDAFIRIGRAVGQVLMPVLKPLAQFMLSFSTMIFHFADTVVGKVIIAVLALTITLTGLGLVAMGLIMIISALNTAILAAWSLMAPVIPIVLAVIGVIIALAASLKLLSKLLNSTNDTLFAFGIIVGYLMGPVGWLAGGIMLLVRGWKDFTKVLEGAKEPADGILGFFQKIGGLLQATVMLFKTADRNGFALSQSMHDALKRMGILELVISIGTWVVRLKAIWIGFKDVALFTWMKVKEAIKSATEAFMKLTGGSERWNDWLGKNTTDIEKWRKVGYYAFYGVLIIVGLLTLALIGLAVVSAVIWLPFLVAIAVVIASIWLFYKWIVRVIQIYEWLTAAGSAVFDPFGESLDGAWGKMKEFANWIKDLHGKAFTSGVSFVKAFWEGMKSVWSSFMDWIQDKLGGTLFGKAFNFVLGSDESNSPISEVANPKHGSDMSRNENSRERNENDINRNEGIITRDPYFDRAGDVTAENRANNFITPSPTVFDKSTKEVKYVEVRVDMDGEEVGRKVIEKMNEEDARN